MATASVDWSGKVAEASGKVAEAYKMPFVRTYVRALHDLATGRERIKLRAENPWLRAEHLAGPKGKLP